MSKVASRMDYGNNPKVQKKLAIAARVMRSAITVIDQASEVAGDGTDDELRCLEAKSELESALYYVEWKPPRTRAKKVRS